jgi:ubiquinone/menaquinone biosynthesis C-methylase UbiE
MQLALYSQIAGVPYSLDQEATKFDIESALRNPFPFSSRSTAVAGEYFMAIGFLLNTMALPKAAHILEFGPGWGVTTLSLAKLGHKVTVIEIEPCFCELIRRQAKLEGVDVEVVNADFFCVEKQSKQFDAVLFYDCFHHCDDHMRLLRALNRVVRTGGRIFFGGEPISNDFEQAWGLRLDGWALWGIRKNGWMELGFREDYFAEALLRTGWFGRKHSVPGLNRLRVWEAQRSSEVAFRYSAGGPDIRTEIGRINNGHIVLDGTRRGTGLFGPYVDLPAGSYDAHIFFAADEPLSGEAVMDIAVNCGGKRLAERAISFLDKDEGSVQLPFETAGEDRGVEVRLMCEPGFKATVIGVEIKPRLAQAKTAN